MKSIHKFIIQLHVLQCLFVRGSNKKEKKGRIISNFIKEDTFCLLWQPIALRIVSMWPFFLHPQGKLTDLLLDCQGVPYSHRQRRNMIVQRSKLCLPTPKTPSFSLLFGQKQNILGHLFDIRTYWFALKAARVWYFLFPHTGRVHRGC